jgi:magnesium-transporting ATPase (P-type)
MYIETPEKTIAKGDKEVFEFLSDLKNFEILMPENIDKFEVLSEDRFLFALKGMPEIILERKSQNKYSQLVLGAASEKLPFTLTADISDKSGSESNVVLSFKGEFNAMMAMMIKSPITNFMGKLSENLSKI